MPVALTVLLDAALFLICELVSVQLPVLPVTQLPLPPGEKLPDTVALATAAPLLMSRTVTTAEARQLLRDELALPAMDFTATVWAVCAGGAILPPLPCE